MKILPNYLIDYMPEIEKALEELRLSVLDHAYEMLMSLDVDELTSDEIRNKLELSGIKVENMTESWLPNGRFYRMYPSIKHHRTRRNTIQSIVKSGGQFEGVWSDSFNNKTEFNYKNVQLKRHYELGSAYDGYFYISGDTAFADDGTVINDTLTSLQSDILLNQALPAGYAYIYVPWPEPIYPTGASGFYNVNMLNVDRLHYPASEHPYYSNTPASDTYDFNNINISECNTPYRTPYWFDYHYMYGIYIGEHCEYFKYRDGSWVRVYYPSEGATKYTSTAIYPDGYPHEEDESILGNSNAVFPSDFYYSERFHASPYEYSDSSSLDFYYIGEEDVEKTVCYFDENLPEWPNYSYSKQYADGEFSAYRFDVLSNLTMHSLFYQGDEIYEFSSLFNTVPPMESACYDSLVTVYTRSSGNSQGENITINTDTLQNYLYDTDSGSPKQYQLTSGNFSYPIKSLVLDSIISYRNNYPISYNSNLTAYLEIDPITGYVYLNNNYDNGHDEEAQYSSLLYRESDTHYLKLMNDNSSVKLGPVFQLYNYLGNDEIFAYSSSGAKCSFSSIRGFDKHGEEVGLYNNVLLYLSQMPKGNSFKYSVVGFLKADTLADARYDLNSQWKIADDYVDDSIIKLLDGEYYVLKSFKNKGVNSSHAKLNLYVNVYSNEGINLSFKVYNSSESNYDYLSVYIDGNLASDITTAGSWINYSTGNLYPKGSEYVITFDYHKDSSAHVNNDCSYLAIQKEELNIDGLKHIYRSTLPDITASYFTCTIKHNESAPDAKSISYSNRKVLSPQEKIIDALVEDAYDVVNAGFGFTTPEDMYSKGYAFAPAGTLYGAMSNEEDIFTRVVYQGYFSGLSKNTKLITFGVDTLAEGIFDKMCSKYYYCYSFNSFSGSNNPYSPGVVASSTALNSSSPDTTARTVPSVYYKNVWFYDGAGNIIDLSQSASYTFKCQVWNNTPDIYINGVSLDSSNKKLMACVIEPEDNSAVFNEFEFDLPSDLFSVSNNTITYNTSHILYNMLYGKQVTLVYYT